mmetsp:Transcript_39249/g.62877  ORF Transcript_39249/g.62877 Transcript_39249/m.62877 type:complete len:140 (+) Transcript_39249:60-479(+)
MAKPSSSSSCSCSSSWRGGTWRSYEYCAFHSGIALGCLLFFCPLHVSPRLSSSIFWCGYYMARVSPRLCVFQDRNSRPSVAVSYVGVEASMRKLETYIAEKGPFDGILGFSQGGAAAAVLCAQNPHSFKFAVIISGWVD